MRDERRLAEWAERSTTVSDGAAGRPLTVTGKGEGYRGGVVLSERHYRMDTGDEASFRDCIPHPEQQSMQRH